MANSHKPPPTPFFTVSAPINEARAKHEETAALSREEAVKGTLFNGFTIPGKLPSLNEYQNACRTNRYVGAKFKKDVEGVITLSIGQALQAGTLRRPTLPIRLVFEWHEKTKRRDADNIASAKKFILDALQQMNVIPNDNRKCVIGFTDEVIDDSHDFVNVRIFEVKP